MMRSVVVTGGAGFIGTFLVQSLLSNENNRVLNIDKMTYAADFEFHRALEARDDRYKLHVGDISDRGLVSDLLQTEKPKVVINLAAESHVDRSIDSASDFVDTNYLGTLSMMEASMALWRSSDSEFADTFRFVQVSTDEVFGDLPPDQTATPDSPMRPSSPYAATKAGADLLVKAYVRTYGFPGIVTHATNNYGPRQFPEKLIPVVIATALSGESIPVYGRGHQVRDWIHVEDHVSGLIAVTERGQPGQTYCIAGGNSCTNLEVVTRICSILDELVPDCRMGSYTDQIALVADRPGHDERYAMNDSFTRKSLGWAPRIPFETGLHDTVSWFVSNRHWWEPAGGYRYARLGSVNN